MDYVFLIIAIFLCIIGIFWVKNAHDKEERSKKDKILEVIVICGCVFLLAISICLIAFNMKTKTNPDATPKLDDSVVEESSILNFFDDYIDSKTSPDDLRKLLGDSCTEDALYSSYFMRYPTSQYTLNGVACDDILAVFDLDVENGKILFITWQYDQPDVELYNELLDYISLVLGDPESQDTSYTGSLSAQWPGYSLECDEYRVSFSRDFYLN